MVEWRLETRKVSSLKDHPRNPRILSKHEGEHLQISIKKFGLIDKPIITKDGRIIGGHQRKNILKKLAIKQVECWVPNEDLTDEQIDELNIRLNKNTGDWDYDILANEWDQEKLIEYGFTEEELLGESIQEILNEEEEESEILEPAKDEDAHTKTGDIYELNNHRIVCGDSTNPDNVHLCLNKEIPILMVTDPPYGVEYDPDWRGKAGKGQKASGKVQNDDKVNWSLAWHLFPGSVAYIWHASFFTSEVHKSLLDSEYEIKSNIIWAKQHFALSRGDYHWKHEPCWYAVKKGHPHNWQGARDQSTVWEIANLNCFGKSKEEGEERTSHSTQKPIECMARPIRNNTAIGEGVYDPFLGSGTTLIACQQLNRICYGIEISPAYVDVIVNRWVKYMKKNNKEFIIKRNGEPIQWQDQKSQ